MQANSNRESHMQYMLVFNEVIEATSAFALDAVVNILNINHMTVSLRLC